MQRVLISYFSRSGHIIRLANVLAEQMRNCGHEVTAEAIHAESNWSKWLLPIPLLPLLPIYLTSARFRRLWHRIHYQSELAIRPLSHADVSGFDLVLLGTPKWLYLSWPVAR